MHYLGVLHGDLEPRNVLRKRWSYIFKIIDFGFSDVDHTCPGWRECGELKKVRCELQLDRVNFRFKSMVPEGFKNRPVAHLDYLVLPFIALLFTWLFFVVISGTLHRMWPQIH
jgi:serine/threonine protein kinase